MSDELVTQYHCSQCNAILSSEGDEADRHIQDVHGFSPFDPTVSIEERGDRPYLIPVESNPVLDKEGIPVTDPVTV